MASGKDDYEEQEILIPISSNKTVGDEDQRSIDVKRIGKVVGITVAGVAVGGPLLTVVSTTVAAALCVAAVGLPLVLLISPVLFIPCFMLVGTTAGFSLASVMAYAGVSTLKWVFQYARDRPFSEGKTEETVSRGGDYDEEDIAAKTLDEGWKQKLHQKNDAVGRERVEEAVEEEEDQSAKDEEIRVTGDEDDKEDVVDSASSQSDKDKEKDKKEPSSSQKSKKQKNPKKK